MMLSLENLSSDATEQEVRRLFSSYGMVKSIKLTLGPLHSKHPGSGVVEIEGDHAKSVVAVLDRCVFRGEVLRVKETWIPGETAMPVEGVSADRLEEPAPDHNNRTHNTLRVATVEKLIEPIPGQSNEWCRYTITSGASCITGLRRGSVAEVTQYAEEAAESFNLRNMLKCGRSHVWSSRSKT